MSGKKNRKIVNFPGFTLVEVMVALSIIMVGMLGAFGLVNQTISVAKTASMQLTAAYLAKEGIELVKSIRDNNYLNIHYNDTGTWSDGLQFCEFGCGVDYTMLALDSAYADMALKHDGSFFNYTSGTITPYRRKIEVDTYADYVNIRVIVTWSERGRNHQLRVQENLYNWWPQ